MAGQGDSRAPGLLPAYSLALAATVLPLAGAVILSDYTESEGIIGTSAGLAIAGLLIGPSAGQFYAQSYKHAWLSSGVRLAGAFMGSVGFAAVLSDAYCGWDTEEDVDCEDHSALGVTLLAGGVLTYAGGIVYSLVDTHRRVEDWPARRGGKRHGWSPIFALDKQGALRPGAAAWMRF
jgi:hypothetical protein